METTVAQLHCRYRAPGPPVAAGRVAGRLDSAAAEVPEAMDRVLASALGDDPAVYVLRRVADRTRLRLRRDQSDREIARHWGGSLATAVLRHIAGRDTTTLAGADSDSARDKVVRFDDEIDYTARFLADLLAGEAWDRWYYYPFASSRGTPRGRVVRDLLRRHRTALDRLLALLDHRRQLSRLLDAVGETELAELCGTPTTESFVFRHSQARRDEVHALLQLGRDLLERLGLLARHPPSLERWLELYLATEPDAPSWQDTASLADALIDILRFAAGQGLVRSAAAMAELTASGRLDEVLGDFDWLDVGRLRDELIRWPSPPSGPPTVRHGPTPRQRELLADLGQIIDDGELDLDRQQPAGQANVLRLRARLAAQMPRWFDDAGAHRLIESLLRLWGWLARQPASAETLRWIERSKPVEAGDLAAADLELVNRCGPLTAGILRSLVAGDAPTDKRRRDAHASLPRASEVNPESRLARSLDAPDGDRPHRKSQAEADSVVAVDPPARPDPVSRQPGGKTGNEPEVRRTESDPEEEPPASRSPASPPRRLSTDPRSAPEKPSRSTPKPARTTGAGSLAAPALATSAQLPKADTPRSESLETSIPQPSPSGSHRPEAVTHASEPRQPLERDAGRAQLARRQATWRELFGELWLVLQRGCPQLDWNDLASDGNVEKLSRAVTTEPHDREPVRRLIGRLLAAAATLAGLGRGETGSRFDPSYPADGSAVHPPDGSAVHRADDLAIFDQLGEPAAQIAEELVRLSAAAATASSTPGRETPAPSSDLGLANAGSQVLIETRCAGVFLLVRAIEDAMIPSLLEQAAYPTEDQAGRLRAMLSTLGLAWGGETALDHCLDPGLAWLADWPAPPQLEDLRRPWRDTVSEDHQRWQSALLRLLAGQRLLGSGALHLHEIVTGGKRAIVAGAGSVGLWPLGRVFDHRNELPGIVADWRKAWLEACGHSPETVLCDPDLTEVVATTLELPVSAVMSYSQAANEGSQPGLAEHRDDRQALLEALDMLGLERLAVPGADLTAALTAAALLRLWARWLPSFSLASVPFLLKELIHRPGRLSIEAHRVTAELEPGPIDMVIEMAGYLAPLERVAWLGDRRLELRLRRSP